MGMNCGVPILGSFRAKRGEARGVDWDRCVRVKPRVETESITWSGPFVSPVHPRVPRTNFGLCMLYCTPACGSRLAVVCCLSLFLFILV